MILIYCLVNPLNNQPFYVGATKSSLKTRLAGHIHDAKSYCSSPPFFTDTISGKKHRLILHILDNSYSPLIIKLAEVDIFSVDFYESFYFQHLKKQGFALLQLPSAFQYNKKYLKINKEIFGN